MKVLTEHWTAFMDYVGIPVGQLVKHTDATFAKLVLCSKIGGQTYLQNVHDPL